MVISISLFSLSYKIQTWAESNRKFSLLTVRLFLILQSYIFSCQFLEFLHVSGVGHPMYYGLVLDRPVG